MAARDELVAAIAGRYAQGDRSERGRILNEFTAVTGFHRKHAMRLLRAGQVNRRSGPRLGRRVYNEAVREVLIVVWEASDRICGNRLQPLLPILVEAMERHGDLQLSLGESASTQVGIIGHYPAYQCTGPGGVLFASCPTASVIRRQVAAPS
jgi:hypothetical protein